MSNPGIGIRLERIAPSGRAVIVPMDHGVSSGPIQGLEDPARTVAQAAHAGASAVVVHKGLVPTIAPALGDTALIVHLSASTDLNPDPHDKRLVTDVQEALSMGADGVSVHANIGARTESRMIEDLGHAARACTTNGVPLLAMMYPRGPDIDDPQDPENLQHAARLGAELGAHLVKVPYSGDPDSFQPVVDGCPVPVVISGGPKTGTPKDLLETVHGAIEAGAAGVSIGRNAFQSDDPRLTIQAMRRIVRDGETVDEVLTDGNTARLTA